MTDILHPGMYSLAALHGVRSGTGGGVRSGRVCVGRTSTRRGLGLDEVGGLAREESGYASSGVLPFLRLDTIALDVKNGDRILFGKYSGTEIKIEGEEHLILREDEVLGIIEK